MNENPRAATLEARLADEPARHTGVRLWVNWALALLTAPAAALVMIFALGAVMSAAACGDRQCSGIGPDGVSFGVLFYGAPVVALVVIAFSFVTAKLRSGIAVPLLGLVLLLADILALAVAVGG